MTISPFAAMLNSLMASPQTNGFKAGPAYDWSLHRMAGSPFFAVVVPAAAVPVFAPQPVIVSSGIRSSASRLTMMIDLATTFLYT